MRRILLALAFAIAAIAAANAQIWIMSPASQTSGRKGAAPAGNGSALLVNNTDAALLINNIDPACLVGGC